MNPSIVSLDNRWLRLVQPALSPYNPALIIGGSVIVDPEISNMNDLARLVELCSSPAFMAYPMLNADPGAASATGGYWNDNVATWNADEPTVLNLPPRFVANFDQFKFRDGLIVAPLKITTESGSACLPAELGSGAETLSIWNYLIIDTQAKVIDRLDPHCQPKQGLDNAITAFLNTPSSLKGFTYRSPDVTGTVYRGLVRNTIVSLECPEFVRFNIWAYWLLYARLSFSDCEQELVYSRIANIFTGAYAGDFPAENVLLTFYSEFTSDGILHAFNDEGFLQKYPSRNDLWRYERAIMNRVYATTTGQLRTTQINQIIGAAFHDYVAGGSSDYAKLYDSYVGADPLFVPKVQNCGGWIPDDQVDSTLYAILHDRELRIGYVVGAPFITAAGNPPTGLDPDIIARLLPAIQNTYKNIIGGTLTTRWINANPDTASTGVSEEEKFTLLYEGLARGDYHIAFSGQLMLTGKNTPANTSPEWACATALIFTAISYTGRPIGTFTPDWAAVIKAGTREAFVKYVAGTLLTKGVDLTFFSVINPGPSPGSTQNLVADINNARGAGANASAVWVNGTEQQTADVIGKRQYHFSVGDSTASGYQMKLLKPVNGVYLNIPAVDSPSIYTDAAVGSPTLLPIAPFTINAR